MFLRNNFQFKSFTCGNVILICQFFVTLNHVKNNLHYRQSFTSICHADCTHLKVERGLQFCGMQNRPIFVAENGKVVHISANPHKKLKEGVM